MTVAASPTEPQYFPAEDARRAGLIVLAPSADAAALHDLCADFAAHGYEVRTAQTGRDARTAVARLAPPVCLLAVGAGAAEGWAMALTVSAIAAVTLFDPDLSTLAEGDPLCPVILHRSATPARADEDEAFRTRHESTLIYTYPCAAGFIWETGDPSRLAGLRNLQLFHRASVGRGEMGG